MLASFGGSWNQAWLAIALALVLEGKVRVVRRAGGRAQVVHVERVGGTLGEVPLFAGGGYPATAIAAEPTVCAVIDRQSLAAALRSSPDAPFVLLERLARRVRELVERLDRAALRPVSARLAEFLIGRADARGRATIALGMTQEHSSSRLLPGTRLRDRNLRPPPIGPRHLGQEGAVIRRRRPAIARQLRRAGRAEQ